MHFCLIRPGNTYRIWLSPGWGLLWRSLLRLRYSGRAAEYSKEFRHLTLISSYLSYFSPDFSILFLSFLCGKVRHTRTRWCLIFYALWHVTTKLKLCLFSARFCRIWMKCLFFTHPGLHHYTVFPRFAQGTLWLWHSRMHRSNTFIYAPGSRTSLCFPGIGHCTV